jgi:hypothetical protein
MSPYSIMGLVMDSDVLAAGPLPYVEGDGKFELGEGWDNIQLYYFWSDPLTIPVPVGKCMSCVPCTYVDPYL